MTKLESHNHITAGELKRALLLGEEEIGQDDSAFLFDIAIRAVFCETCKRRVDFFDDMVDLLGEDVFVSKIYERESAQEMNAAAAPITETMIGVQADETATDEKTVSYSGRQLFDHAARIINSARNVITGNARSAFNAWRVGSRTMFRGFYANSFAVAHKAAGNDDIEFIAEDDAFVGVVRFSIRDKVRLPKVMIYFDDEDLNGAVPQWLIVCGEQKIYSVQFEKNELDGYYFAEMSDEPGAESNELEPGTYACWVICE